MKLACGVAFAALAIPGAALAQSTGTVDAEEDVVVTGSRQAPSVDGIQTPDTPKARAVITQELIARRAPGQTIFDTINLVPGVSFTNSDPYGSSGGQLRIRGFSGDRVSTTFDGIPLNDSGNYAIYTNQQLDPELIEQVNVNFGATDVDSPTASASGGTVNYRSLTPTDEMHAVAVFSHGTFDRNRVFGQLNTGVFTKFGTKMWIAASSDRYDQYRGFGEIYKQQYNFKVYQPIGGSGDFFSFAGHFNKNRNNSYSNPTVTLLRTTATGAVIPTTATPANPYKIDLSRQQYDAAFDNPAAGPVYDFTCVRPAATGVNGTPQNDTTGQCFNVKDTAINPSDTGNLRINSRFSLTDKLTFTFDGAYSFTRANGGGSTVFAEANARANGTNQYNLQFQRVGAGIAAGADLNGDGDLLDNVRVYWPSNTRTQRFTAIAGLRYDLDDNNLVRIAYTWDRARHRQTGEASQLSAQGVPFEVFSALDGEGPYAVRDAAGNVLTKRNRLSYAILHQVSGEYRGQFFEDKLKVALGVRAPFFRRNLNNYCYTISGNSSDAYCTSQSAASVAANTTTAGYGLPYQGRIKSYNTVLPNVGLTYDLVGDLSVFASYAKGYSVPKTDNLYSFDDVKFSPVDEVRPEKTDTFDLGLRYSSRTVQAQIAGWYTYYKNRIISSLVQLEGGATQSLDRNVGAVKQGGVDASVAVRPVRWLSLYGFGSYFDSELQNDATNPLTGAIIAATRGKFTVESPQWQYGGRAQLDLGPVSGGIEAKHTGDRWVTDINDLESAGYTVINADVRLSLAPAGLERTYLQFNATNLLKERYFSNIATNTQFSSNPRLTFGAPRTFIGSIHFEF